MMPHCEILKAFCNHNSLDLLQRHAYSLVTCCWCQAAGIRAAGDRQPPRAALPRRPDN
jgi:hypothetical protein